LGTVGPAPNPILVPLIETINVLLSFEAKT
jgi:hypothetical protein